MVVVTMNPEARLNVSLFYERIWDELHSLLLRDRGFNLSVVEDKAWIHPFDPMESREYVKIKLYPTSLMIEGFIEVNHIVLLYPLLDLIKCMDIGFHVAASYLPHIEHYFHKRGVSLSAEIVFTDY